MNYVIDIYAYSNQYIFCGSLYMHFDKYKGIYPGIFSKPILVLPATASPTEIESAIIQCETVLKENETLIREENAEHTYTQMESLLFKNFKLVGVKASRSAILKEATLVSYENRDKSCITRSTATGRNMIIQDENPVLPGMTLAEVTKGIKALLP